MGIYPCVYDWNFGVTKMTKIKKVFKYATGQKIPKGAVYLNTISQTRVQENTTAEWIDCWLVWHYFLVEVEE